MTRRERHRRGMVKFQKPGASDEYNVMAKGAIQAALGTPGVDFAEVAAGVRGLRVRRLHLRPAGRLRGRRTGIPVINVNNNCSTGSTALCLGAQAVEGGVAECVLAVGFEQMQKGALEAKWTDRTNPIDQHVGVMNGAAGA